MELDLFIPVWISTVWRTWSLISFLDVEMIHTYMEGCYKPWRCSSSSLFSTWNYVDCIDSRRVLKNRRWVRIRTKHAVYSVAEHSLYILQKLWPFLKTCPLFVQMTFHCRGRSKPSCLHVFRGECHAWGYPS